MTTPFNPEIRESFDERIEILFRELELALKWDRPSILLAIYSSHYVRADAERALDARLRELNQTTTEYLVNEANADILINLSEHPRKATTVFYIAGLQNGGGADGRNAYRALNLRREYFVDYRIRAVVWLTEKEASVLPRYAPDFWAFRHRVVEFMDRPEPHAAKIASEVAWSGLDDRTAREDTDAKIELRLALLKDLPEGDETLAARADLQFTLAGLYWAKREFEESIKYFQDAIAIAEKIGNAQLQSWCHNGLGLVLAQDATRVREAEAEFRAAMALDPKYAKAHYNLGNLLADDATRVREAEAEYRAAMALDPKYAAAHNNLGLLLAQDATRAQEAEAEYRAAIELDPKDAAAHNNLGNLLAKDATRVREAEAEYRAAMALDPKDALPHNGLGLVLADDATRVREAEAEYRAAIELDPKHINAHNNLGNLLAKDATRVREAEAEYRAAIALDPKLAQAHHNLGNLLSDDATRVREAEAEYRAAIELDPKNAGTHHRLGHLLQNDPLRKPEAEAAFRKAIELEPTDSENHRCLGVLLAKDATRVREAEAEYRAAMELDPKHVNAHNNLGALLAKDATRVREAEAEFRAAIELDPKYAAAHNNLGLLLARDATRVREAEAEYRAAMALDPKDAGAHNNLGNLLAKDAARAQEAEAEYRAAIEYDPNNTSTYLHIMILLRQNDRAEESLPFVEKWMQLDPQNFGPPLALASIHKKYGRLSESAKFAAQARARMKSDDWYNLACLESVCGNVDAAVAHLRRAAQSEKFDPDWAKRDWDLEWIREDARFKEIVGNE